MKKKNTFKNNIVQNEDGTRSYKNENLWMHSIDRPVNENECTNIAVSFAILILLGIVVFLIMFVIGG